MTEQSATNNHSSESDSEVLVKVENLGKIFCRDLKKSLYYGLKDSLKDLISIGNKKSDPAASRRKLRQGEFWANRDISFELKRGECLGLIGHNGAGKTTLLKMLNGLIKPDCGHIEMRGSVGALIALGAGFNPILTGRENIYINGSVLGLSTVEIDEQIEDIIDFSEIREFIDAPVQTYSSGMQVRLGFSIASSIKPDILILDEVLAVGDVGFVVKCLNRVRELASDCAVIFVSHSMQFVSSFCTRVIVMDQGETLLDASNPSDGINCYYSQMEFKGTENGDGSVILDAFNVLSNGICCAQDIEIFQGEEVGIDMAFSIDFNAHEVFVTICIDDEAQSQVITCPVMDDKKNRVFFKPGSHGIKTSMGLLDLNAGSYSFQIVVQDARSRKCLLRKSGVAPFRVRADTVGWSKIVRPIVLDDIS